MNKRKRQITAFLAGVFIFLVFLEIFLRLVGGVYAKLSEADSSRGGKAATTILCIGDSFTFGIGAPKELSYPAQLEDILNDASEEQKSVVINRGWPGKNSSQFLRRLEGYLQEFQPDIVTILIGGQNLINHSGYQEYLSGSGVRKTSVKMSVHHFLSHIRIYRFIRLLFVDSWSGWAGKGDFPGNEPARTEEDGFEQHVVPECIAGLEAKEKGNDEEALELIRGAARKKRIGAACANIAGSIYKERKNYDEATLWFKRGIEDDPTFFKNYEDIGHTLLEQDNMREAISWYKKGFANARYETLHPGCYEGIYRAFVALDDTAGAVEFFETETNRDVVFDDYLQKRAAHYLAAFQQDKTGNGQVVEAGEIEQQKERHAVPDCVKAFAEMEKGNDEGALKLILAAEETGDINTECASIAGSIYQKRALYDKAVVWFEKGLAVDPSFFENYEGIGHCFYEQNKLEEAIIWYKKGFENGDYATIHPEGYKGIGLAYAALNDPEGAMEFFEGEMKKAPVANGYLQSRAADYLALFQKNKKNEDVYNWLRSDLKKMFQLCRQYGARPVLQTYPYMPEINFLFIELAAQENVSLVDHQKTFEKYADVGNFDDKLFIPDGHPNAKGYRLMAENIKKVLEKEPGREQ